MSDGTPRLDISIEGMRDYYPLFSLSVTTTGIEREAIWTGRVQPIRTIEMLEELLDDIHNERPYYILPDGEVLHHPSCTATHKQHGWTEKLINPHVVYELEVRYGGRQAHPKAYVRDPLLPEDNRPHTFNDGSICPYAPWNQVWLWEEHSVVDYMGHTLGWLIKWTVWEQVKTWIGPEMSHDPRFLLRTVGPNKQCWCGSGTKYKKCHRFQDEANAVGQH
jgi:SEC-C motif